MADIERPSLDAVQSEFEKNIGHRPHTVQQMLNYCKHNNILYKFRDINKWWPTRPEPEEKPVQKPINVPGEQTALTPRKQEKHVVNIVAGIDIVRWISHDGMREDYNDTPINCSTDDQAINVVLGKHVSDMVKSIDAQCEANNIDIDEKHSSIKLQNEVTVTVTHPRPDSDKVLEIQENNLPKNEVTVTTSHPDNNSLEIQQNITFSSKTFAFSNGVVDWTFSDNDYDKFLKLDEKQRINGPTFKLNDMDFHVDIKIASTESESVNCNDSNDRYIHLYLAVDKDKFPKNVDTFTIYYTMTIQPMNYEYRFSKIFSKNDNIATIIVNESLKKMKSLDSLRFNICPEIVKIDYNEKNRANENIENKFMPKPVSMKSNVKYEWKLNKNQLKRFESADANIVFNLYSNNFNNDCFCITCSQSQGIVFTKIHLLKLPNDIKSVLCECKVEIESKSNDIYFCVENNVKRFFAIGYNEKIKNTTNDKMLLELFKNAKDITISVTMKLLKVCKWNDNENNIETGIIDKNKWNNYNIIQIKDENIETNINPTPNPQLIIENKTDVVIVVNKVDVVKNVNVKKDIWFRIKIWWKINLFKLFKALLMFVAFYYIVKKRMN